MKFAVAINDKKQITKIAKSVHDILFKPGFKKEDTIVIKLFETMEEYFDFFTNPLPFNFPETMTIKENETEITNMSQFLDVPKHPMSDIEYDDREDDVNKYFHEEEDASIEEYKHRYGSEHI